MGIVVSVLMLLGVWALAPLSRFGLSYLVPQAGVLRPLAMTLLAGGTWNALWYGLRHPQQFWGLAALISGVLMVLAARLVWRRAKLTAEARNSAPMSLAALIVCGGLFLCFTVYANALVRLNLGYPIWG